MALDVNLSVLSKLYERYEVFRIAKSRGRWRTIHVPDNELKEKQQLYLGNEVKCGTGPGPFSMAFAYSRGVRTHAVSHVGKKFVFEMDLKDFFHHVTPEHLIRTWRDLEGLGRDELKVRFKPIDPRRLSQYAPPWGLVHLAFIPSSKVSGDMFGACLPQGSPLSPYLSNIAFKPIDFSVNAYLRKMFGEGNYAYTRYADNLVVSSDSGSVAALKGIMRKILEGHNFPVNTRKFRYMTAAQRQSVCGINVNRKLNFHPRLRDRYRGRVHRLFMKATTRRGSSPDGNTRLIRESEWPCIAKEFRHVHGMMSYARDVAPDFYAKYREKMATVKVCLKAVGAI